VPTVTGGSARLPHPTRGGAALPAADRWATIAVGVARAKAANCKSLIVCLNWPQQLEKMGCGGSLPVHPAPKGRAEISQQEKVQPQSAEFWRRRTLALQSELEAHYQGQLQELRKHLQEALQANLAMAGEVRGQANSLACEVKLATEGVHMPHSTAEALLADLESTRSELADAVITVKVQHEEIVRLTQEKVALQTELDSREAEHAKGHQETSPRMNPLPPWTRSPSRLRALPPRRPRPSPLGQLKEDAAGEHLIIRREAELAGRLLHQCGGAEHPSHRKCEAAPCGT